MLNMLIKERPPSIDWAAKGMQLAGLQQKTKNNKITRLSYTPYEQLVVVVQQ